MKSIALCVINNARFHRPDIKFFMQYVYYKYSMGKVIPEIGFIQLSYISLKRKWEYMFGDKRYNKVIRHSIHVKT